MTAVPLFLDSHLKLSFEKTAGTPVKLSDSPERWQQEVASELFKQLPYIADYAVNVILDKVEAQRGYAMGTAELSHKKEPNSTEHGSTESADKDQPRIRIPLIVKDRMLQPLDVFVDGTDVWPLSERRVHEHLFRTKTFELSTRKPYDQGIMDKLYPPMRNNYGFGNSSISGGAMGKFASTGLLDLIAPTINQQSVDEFMSELQRPEMKAALVTNPVFMKAAHKILFTERASIEKRASALVESIVPTVVQITKLDDGNVLFKWAAAGAYMPQEGTMPAAQAGQMLGADKVKDMQPGQTMTISSEKAQKQSLSEEKIEVISDFGVYRCQDADSKEWMVGWILPVMSWDMKPLPLFLFTDGQRYSVQDEIAGSRAGHDVNIPESQPQGDGCFFYVDNEHARAFTPVTIQNQNTDPEGNVSYQASDVWGQPITLSVAPGSQMVQAVGEGQYTIPDTLKWLPLTGQPLHLLKSPEEVETFDAAKAMPSQVNVQPSGQDRFSLSGDPLQKVAEHERKFISRRDAEFLLVGMGMNPFEAKEKLAYAEKRQMAVQVRGLNPITPLGQLHEEMTKKASVFLSSFPKIRVNLVKEAASIQDPETVDKVLSLNFLNPENISTFAAFVPELDSAVSKLAQMLLSARLGQREIPEASVERAMHHLEESVQALKAVQQKDSAGD